MTTGIDNGYRTEKLLDWERKSLTDKFSDLLFSKRSNWMSFGLINLVISVFGLITPFIPPRYGRGHWSPPRTSDEYWHRVSNFWIAVPLVLFAVFACINIRNKIDLFLGIKRIANFKVTEVLNLGPGKILLMNGWRPFYIRAKQPYFHSVVPGHIISIKRTGTFRLIDYYIRDEQRFFKEQNGK